jgi:hypothetical protein
MATRRAFRSAALAVLLAAAPSLAQADDKAVREAQARFEEGLKRVRAGDFESARMSFVQAYVVLHNPDILWNLALSEEKSGHALDGLAHFKEFAKQAPGEGDRARAQKHIDALMAQTGHLDVLAPAGTSLTLDGATSIGMAPLAATLDVAPGHHVIEGKLTEGTKALSVDAVAGQLAHVSFLVAGPDRPLPPPAIPTSAPEENAPAPPVASGLTPPATAPGSDETRSDPSTARLVTTTALGGGAVIAIGLGVYFGLQSRSDASTAAAFRGEHSSSYCVNPATDGCAQWNGVVQAQNRDATASNILYVTGALLAVGAAASWFFWPRDKETKSAGAWLLPTAGPSGAGVVAGGRF